jgi:hypothetical protein
LKRKLVLALSLVALVAGVMATTGAAGTTASSTSIAQQVACLAAGQACCPSTQVDALGLATPCCDGAGQFARSFSLTDCGHVGTKPKPPPKQVSLVFLCYSPGGNPGVYPADDVADLLSMGYTMPLAVAGNVDGGNNLGGFHLSCDPTLKPSGHYIDGAGDNADELAMAGYTGGLYPVAA